MSFAGIVPDALLEHERHLANVIDSRRRIAVDHDEVGLLAGGDRPDERAAAEERGAVQRADFDRLERREARFDEQLERALVGVAGDHAAAARRIGADEQRAAGAKKVDLELRQLSGRASRRSTSCRDRSAPCAARTGRGGSDRARRGPGGSGRPGVNGLEHRERRRQRDLSSMRCAHERPHRVAGRIDRGERRWSATP